MHRGKEMIAFEIKKNLRQPGEFCYDLRALAQSFYPEKSCEILEREDWSEESGYPVRCMVEGEEILSASLSEGYDKNRVKEVVYRTQTKKSVKSYDPTLLPT